MNRSRLGPRDVTATFIVAAVATLYAMFQAGASLGWFDGTRIVATTVFVLGLIACSAGADADTFKRGNTTRPVITFLSFLGATAMVVGILAIALGSDALLAALVALTLALWAFATLRHLLLKTPTAHTGPTPAASREFAHHGR